jgi:hypothetical protein
MSKLLFEINSVNEKSIINKLPDLKTNTNKATISGSKSLKNWTNTEVQNWLDKACVNQEIFNVLKLFDGEMMVQLSRVKKTAK